MSEMNGAPEQAAPSPWDRIGEFFELMTAGAQITFGTGISHNDDRR